MTSRTDSSDVHSDVWLVARLIGRLLLTPITLILLLFGRRTLSDLLEPFTLIIRWLLEAPVSLGMTITISIAFGAQIIFGLDRFALYPGLVLFEPWTLITSGFLHANLGHLAWNSLWLLLFGRVVEMSYGKARWLVIYFVSMIAGSLSYIALALVNSDPAPAIGASGAISGLIGAAMLSNPLRISFASIVPMPIAAAAGFYLLTNTFDLLSGTNTGVAHIAHLGGLLAGALIANAFKPEHRRLGWISVAIFSAIILALRLV